MTREIKFRAWEKKGRIMIDWFTITQTAFNRSGEPAHNNYLQVGNTHCFGCHKTYPPNSAHQKDCQGLQKEYKQCQWDSKTDTCDLAIHNIDK